VNEIRPSTKTSPTAATSGRSPGSRAAWAGVAFGVLYAVSFFMLRRIPDAHANAHTVTSFYDSHRERLLVVVAGIYLVPLAGVALLWFTAAVRHRVLNLVASEDALLSTVQLLSAAVYVALLFGATAVLTAPAIAVDSGAMSVDDLAGTKPLLVFGDTILVVFALRSAGVFIAAGTTRARRAGLIPRWFAVVSYLIVVILLLTVARFRAVSLLFPAWVTTVSLIVLKRRGTAIPSTSA
jgi:hypothetical protein